MTSSPLEFLARRERIAALASLALVVVLSLWLLQAANDRLMAFDLGLTASPAYAALLFVMWWAMMLAMMLPSVAPALLVFAAMARRLARAARPELLILAFAAGYAAVWTGFSLAATLLHLLLAALADLTPMMAVVGRGLGGLLLIAAGLYQLTPLKQSCLSRCQTPLVYFARRWRKSAAGALRLGLDHGLYCLGCCAVLMAVLFYGGVMEPLWIGGLALYVLIEKLIPASSGLSRYAGLLLVVAGAAVLIGLL